MAIFKCKMCGGTLNVNNNETVAVCEYCGTKQTLPKLDDEKRIQLYDRANHFRRENEFDKAMGIYEMILSEDKEDCESYWGLVLCRYGIEYVEDPRTHTRIPTVNRAQFVSIFDDKDYKNAIEYADGYQREIYEAEAGVIDKIQKRILEISSKEEPFDVFICYKETDQNGNRTQDSVYAQDIYTALTKEGYKVFFSRITLEDKLGSAYEPYIFAALNSAKVMLVVGTEKDNFNAVWVKNEWSRYISLIKAGKEKTLIPVYKNISPYDMPEEFQYLQSQDMGKIGFMQDLVRGVQKLVPVGKETVKETVVVTAGNSQVEPLLKRAFMFLEDGDWQSADEYCEKVLDIDPENGLAYLVKMLASLQITKLEKLTKATVDFVNNKDYIKAVRFADENLKTELERLETTCNEKHYKIAVALMEKSKNAEEFSNAAEAFKKLGNYSDSKQKSVYCEEQIEIIENRIKQRKKLQEDINKKRSEIDLFFKNKQVLESECMIAHEKIKQSAKSQKKVMNIIFLFAILNIVLPIVFVASCIALPEEPSDLQMFILMLLTLAIPCCFIIYIVKWISAYKKILLKSKKNTVFMFVLSLVIPIASYIIAIIERIKYVEKDYSECYVKQYENLQDQLQDCLNQLRTAENKLQEMTDQYNKLA